MAIVADRSPRAYISFALEQHEDAIVKWRACDTDLGTDVTMPDNPRWF